VGGLDPEHAANRAFLLMKQKERNMETQKLTKQQAAIIGAYTGVLCGDFSDMHAYVEKVMGHPVFTHEMGSKDFTEQLRSAAKADFLSICA
jgi:hypothetical protein